MKMSIVQLFQKEADTVMSGVFERLVVLSSKVANRLEVVVSTS